MKLLLDECVPKQFGKLLIGHTCLTVPQAGWAGIKNGKLLKLAQADFEAFITVDQNLKFQQNFDSLTISIVVIQARSNALEDLTPFIPKLLSILTELPVGQAILLKP